MAGIINVESDEELLTEADIVLSIVTPSEAVAVAHRFASHMSSNHSNVIYVDMNAIAPETVCSIASLFPGGNFVDGSIVGPPPRVNECLTSIYLSGKHAQKVADIFGDIAAFSIHVIGERIGQASGLKMCYATITKGITAVAIHSCVTARSLDLEAIFLDELKRSMPHIFDMVNKFIPDMAPKASRWIGEVEEIAKTHEQVGLTSKMFQGAADTYRFVAECTPLGEEKIEDRKKGTKLSDALNIMAECLNQNKNNRDD